MGITIEKTFFLFLCMCCKTNWGGNMRLMNKKLAPSYSNSKNCKETARNVGKTKNFIKCIETMLSKIF